MAAIALGRGKIVGISWRRLGDKIPENEENNFLSSPVTRSKSRKSFGGHPLRENGMREENEGAGKALLRRALSVREALGTLRQKIRVSTKRRKRLVNVSPYPDSAATTPGSARRSARLAHREEVKLYSPFRIETPNCTGAGRGTPRQIRMGIHTPKRFNFSSPGRYQRDVDAVAVGIQALGAVGDSLSVAIDKEAANTNVMGAAATSSQPAARNGMSRQVIYPGGTTIPVTSVYTTRPIADLMSNSMMPRHHGHIPAPPAQIPELPEDFFSLHIRDQPEMQQTSCGSRVPVFV